MIFAEVKKNTHNNIKQNYWYTVLWGFLLFFIIACLFLWTATTYRNALPGLIDISYESDKMSFEEMQLEINEYLTEHEEEYAAAYNTIQWGNFAVLLLLINPLLVGIYRFIMNAKNGKANIKDVMYGFGFKGYFNIVKTLALVEFIIFTWSMLFFFPGVYKFVQYSHIWHVLADNREMDMFQAIRITKKMSDGNKMNIFGVNLIFIIAGMTIGFFSLTLVLLGLVVNAVLLILGIVAFGILIFGLFPYYLTYISELYLVFKYKYILKNEEDRNFFEIKN